MKEDKYKDLLNLPEKRQVSLLFQPRSSLYGCAAEKEPEQRKRSSGVTAAPSGREKSRSGEPERLHIILRIGKRQRERISWIFALSSPAARISVITPSSLTLEEMLPSSFRYAS